MAGFADSLAAIDVLSRTPVLTRREPMAATATATATVSERTGDPRRHPRHKWPALRVVLNGRICQLVDCSLGGIFVTGYFEGKAGEKVVGVIAHVDWGAKSRLDFEAHIVRVNGDTGEAAAEFVGLKTHQLDLLMSLLAETPDGEAPAGPLITAPEPDLESLPRERPRRPPSRAMLWFIRTVDKVATGVSVLAVVILVLAIGGFAISILTDFMASSTNESARALVDGFGTRGTTPGAGR
ncbi:MAG: PilZ domain-containing protein [Alphaproteobacteria bacterium]|nr:PilZ domain-containing protein [Alphaproteobacteria bacterium]